MDYQIYLGCVINPISDTKASCYPDGAIVACGKKIIFVGKKTQALKKFSGQVQIFDFGESLLLPTFFDMHFHWVQDDVCLMPKDSLLEWLEKYTFPTEMKFANPNYAKKKAQEFFPKLIECGTLGGACYSSIHACALMEAFDNIVGDFVIGNVLMTMNSPAQLTQKKEDALALVRDFSEKYKSRYAMTPRFAITTDAETMGEGAKLAKKNGSFVQTHLSENKAEIDFVLKLYREQKNFQKIKSYTEIYKKCGILSPKTIMGHAIHLENDELEMLSKSKTAIAHCPTSNAPIKQLGLGSGLFDFKMIERHKIQWALASDIGGGPFLSMLDVMRSFVEQNQKHKVKGATYIKALYRSTLAGAQILKLSKKKGNFDIGKEANIVVFDGKYKSKNAEENLQMLISKGKRKRGIYQHLANYVFYQGRLIYGREK